jgi:hypothetical protein
MPTPPNALAELARRADRGAATPSRRLKILARVDLPALLRGYAVGDEACELAGYGPVAVSAIRDLMNTTDPFLAAVVTKGKSVVGVAHLGRRPTVHQHSALEWLHPTCGVEGCTSLTFLETDHRQDWANTHTTVFDLLDRLCSHNHDSRPERTGPSSRAAANERSFHPTTRAIPATRMLHLSRLHDARAQAFRNQPQLEAPQSIRA